MFVRLSRTIFASATRCPPRSVPLSVVRVSRRTMSATSHAPTKSNDTPWMIGSLVVFGPALLYLLSPSARKNTHGVHNDHHDFPALKEHEGHHATNSESDVVDPVVEIMKDGEGTEANVASSIATSQESDVPNDSTSSELKAETLAAATTEEVPASEVHATTETTPEGTAEGKENSVAPREKGEESPTDLSKAQESAQEGITSKKTEEN